MAIDRIAATYRVETPLDIERAAAILAGEQSSGTFVAVPGESSEIKERFGARVEHVKLLDKVTEPSLPGSRAPAVDPSRPTRFQRGEIVVSWSTENFGFNLPVLVSTLQGNLYELSQFSGLKLIDIELPASFVDHFAGCQYGVAGTRRLTGVFDRPLIGTIIKPSIGLTPQQTAALAQRLVDAGIDFIKDDELMGNPPHSPFDERVDAVMRVIHRHADRTGKRVMVAFNVSDEWDAARRHYDKIVSVGGTCAMVSLNTVGLAGVKKLCDQGELAIHGHRNGWGMLTRHPYLGIEFPAYQKIWRLAGVDQIHVNGIENKFWESDDSVVRSIASCLAPLTSGGTDDRCAILPVVSSGQWGGQAFETFRRTGTLDLLYLAGGGIMAHPDGVAGGITAIQQAWTSALNGETLEQAARQHTELRHAVEKFGRHAI